MSSAVKVVIQKNSECILDDSVDVAEKPNLDSLLVSLEDVQKKVNEVLTKLIEKETGTKSLVSRTDEEEEDEDDEDEDVNEDDSSNVNTKFAFTLLAILSLLTIYEPPKKE